VTRLLQAAGGPKYQAALGVAYGAGLRVSEVVHLTVGAIDSERMVIRVEQGKGKRGRYAMLSPALLDMLRIWWRHTRAQRQVLPGGWLFPGQNPVNPLAVVAASNRRHSRCCSYRGEHGAPAAAGHHWPDTRVARMTAMSPGSEPCVSSVYDQSWPTPTYRTATTSYSGPQLGEWQEGPIQDLHVGLGERLGVKLPGATHPASRRPSRHRASDPSNGRPLQQPLTPMGSEPFRIRSSKAD
jgi:hypothetical protein